MSKGRLGAALSRTLRSGAPVNGSVIKMGLAAAGLALSLGGAQAATVTQLIHFDDAKNGAKTYTTADGNFYFDPTNFQSSSLCADTTEAQGNGSCLIEGKNGTLPTMTRKTGDKTFSLDAFYFLLTGKGTGNTLTFSDGVKSQDLKLNTDYSFVTKYDGGGAAGKLMKDTGYWVDVTALTGFKSITSIMFSASTDAQIRLDCVVTSFDGTTTEPRSGFKDGCGLPDQPAPVPLPASALLLLGGVGGFAALRRRKKA